MAYIPDPSTRETPLAIEEIESLIAGGGRDLTKGRTIGHFLTRVWHTIRMYQERLNDLSKDVDRLAARQAVQPGLATTLNPRDAVQFLSLEEKAELADKTTRDYLARLHKILVNTERERAHITRYANALQVAVVGLLEDPLVPQNVKAALTSIAERARQVDTLPTPEASEAARRELDLAAKRPAP